MAENAVRDNEFELDSVRSLTQKMHLVKVEDDDEAEGREIKNRMEKIETGDEDFDENKKFERFKMLNIENANVNPVKTNIKNNTEGADQKTNLHHVKNKTDGNEKVDKLRAINHKNPTCGKINKRLAPLLARRKIGDNNVYKCLNCVYCSFSESNLDRHVKRCRLSLSFQAVKREVKPKSCI